MLRLPNHPTSPSQFLRQSNELAHFLTLPNRLKEWLADDTPRVIMIDKTFDFANSEGTATGTACRPTGTSACTGSFQKQDWIQDTCESYQQKYTATWDKAAATGMPVASNKSIVGVGSKGVLNGKGLVLKEGAKNIIIQNIHITVGFFRV